jgi:hypothetical protein
MRRPSASQGFDPMTARTPGRLPGPVRFLLLVVVALTLVMWWFKPPGIVYHPDTARDLLLARQVVETSSFDVLAPPSSLGLAGGTVWYRVLSLVQRLGIGEAGLLWGLLALHVGTCLLLFQVFLGVSSRSVACLGMIAYLFGTVQARFDPLWQPTLVLPLAELLLFFSYRALARPGGHGAAVYLAQAVFVVGTQVHFAFFLLTPGMILLSLRAPRRGLAVGSLVLGTVAGWILLSRAQLLRNLESLWQAVAEHVPLVGQGGTDIGAWDALVLPGVVFLIAALLPRVCRRKAGAQPAFAQVARFTVLSFVALYLLGALLRPGASRYIMPIAAPFWVLVSRELNPLLAPWMRRLRPLAVVLGLALWVVLLGIIRATDVERPRMYFQEVRAIQQRLDEHGMDIHAIYRSVHSAQARGGDFSAAVWAGAPCLRESPRLGIDAGGGGTAVLMTILPPGEVSESALPGPAMWLRGGIHDIVLIPYEPYLQAGAVRLCPGPEELGSACAPYDLSFHNEGYGRACFDGGWPNQARATVPRAGEEEPSASGTPDEISSLLYEVLIPGGATSRIISLAPAYRCGAVRPECSGRIVGVAGVDATISADGRRATLRGGDLAQRGIIRISPPWLDGACRCGEAAELPRIAEMDAAVHAVLSPWFD